MEVVILLNTNLFMQMGPIEEKLDLESDEDISFGSSTVGGKVHSFDFETTNVGSHADVVNSWAFKRIRMCPLRSVYIVLIKAKINLLLPFGPSAIFLHYFTSKHVRLRWFFIILPFN